MTRIIGVAVLLSVFAGYVLDMASGQIAYNVLEEVKVGTTVGNITKDINLSLKELTSREFRLVSDSKKQYFRVEAKTGVLQVNERIDREKLCDSAVLCAINLEALANSPLQLYQVRINIFDVNDNFPVFPVSSTYLNITEITATGARFPVQSAHDADIGVNSVKTYKMDSNEFFTLDVQAQSEKVVSAELVLIKVLDREKDPNIDLLITAYDGGSPVMTGTLKIKVNVLDANDNAPVFTKSLYKVSIAEDTAVGTTIIRVQAKDADEGFNGEVIYSFMSHTPQSILNIFDIDSETGNIKLIRDIDYEENNAFEIRVQAADKGTVAMSGHTKLLVEVLDINDNPPSVTVTSLLSPIEENAAKGMVVALLTITDKDSGKNGAVKCRLESRSPFKLHSAFQNYYSLILDAGLDRETNAEYNITIIAVDEGSPPLYSTKIINVKVADVNDNAPGFSDKIVYAYLKENSKIGSVICVLKAIDLDINDNALITYSLLKTTINSTPVSSLFSINSITGEIQSIQSFDYENIKICELKIQATDSGVPPLSSNVTVNIFILDENDNVPLILTPYSDHGSVHTENIAYSAEAGYFVAKIRAVDSDSGYNALLSYHISEPKGNNLFRIGTSSGEIRTKRRMSDNDLKTHPLVIVVSDSGEPSLSATVSIDAVVVDSIDDIKTRFKHAPIKKDSFSDLNKYLLIGIVSVSATFLLSLISLIAVKCCRTDGNFRRYSDPVITTHPDGSWSYSKSTQQYDVCFSADTLKSDVLVFPTPLTTADAELISINGEDPLKGTQTLCNMVKVRTVQTPR